MFGKKSLNESLVSVRLIKGKMVSSSWTFIPVSFQLIINNILGFFCWLSKFGPTLRCKVSQRASDCPNMAEALIPFWVLTRNPRCTGVEVHHWISHSSQESEDGRNTTPDIYFPGLKNVSFKRL